MCRIKFLFLLFILDIVFEAANGKNATVQPVIEYYKFNGIQYMFFSQRATWDEANVLCSTNAAILATPNKKSKAINIAEALADTNLVIENAWIGGRRRDSTWRWINRNDTKSKENIISIIPDNDFPPWIRKPLKVSRECLAIRRRLHLNVNFVDLDCRLLKPFICQKEVEHALNNPVPIKRVIIGRNMFILYDGRLTWKEAVAYCRAQGTRLAIVKNQDTIDIITNAMIKSRPDFENVWVGAQFSYGKWRWISTGLILNSESDKTGYPPWISGKAGNNNGCLLLDRHHNKTTTFIETICDRQRNFMCESYSTDELEDWMNEPSIFVDKNITYIVYPNDKTWDDSYSYCLEKGSFLARVNDLSVANSIVTSMIDHPKELTHVWLGGLHDSNKNIWTWTENKEIIPLEKNDVGYPPWAKTIDNIDSQLDESKCLNMDKSDTSEPYFYGLNCENKQPFVCAIDCKAPPPTEYGTWNCNNNLDETSCNFDCEGKYMSIGSTNINCSSYIGWNNRQNWVEFPLCLDAKDYFNRFIESVNHELHESSGLYVFLAQSNDEVQKYSLRFVEKLLKILRINNYLKMGMTNYFGSQENTIPYKKNDLCDALRSISFMKKGIKEPLNIPINYTDWSTDILNDGVHKSLIVAIMDNDGVRNNQEAFEQLKLAGHSIITIGFRDDWETLLPMTTVGFDNRRNIYLFKENEFENIVSEFKKISSVPSNCKDHKDENNLSESTTVNYDRTTDQQMTMTTSAAVTEQHTKRSKENRKNDEDNRSSLSLPKLVDSILAETILAL